MVRLPFRTENSIKFLSIIESGGHNMYRTILKQVIDSNDFTVGGGSASALAGAMAGGMVAMTAKLSLAKPIHLTKEEYEEIAEKADKLTQGLLKGAELDTKAYCAIKTAYSLPKSTEEEQNLRKQAIQDAAYEAALVPKENGFANKKIYELACRLNGASNPNCSSDLLSAKYLAAAGIKGCILNIKANLPLIKEKSRVNELSTASAELEQTFL